MQLWICSLLIFKQSLLSLRKHQDLSGDCDSCPKEKPHFYCILVWDEPCFKQCTLCLYKGINICYCHEASCKKHLLEDIQILVKCPLKSSGSSYLRDNGSTTLGSRRWEAQWNLRLRRGRKKSRGLWGGGWVQGRFRKEQLHTSWLIHHKHHITMQGKRKGFTLLQIAPPIWAKL